MLKLYPVTNKAGQKGFDFEIGKSLFGFVFFGRHGRRLRLSRGKTARRNIIFNLPLVHGLVTRDGANVITHLGAK